MSEADRAGLAARSPEGHAAKSMHIRGREEEWIQIQANTFKNWVNVNLRECGLEVQDLAQDFTDGTRLVALVETLQKRKLKHNKRPQSQPHALENITIALDAIQEDGIKLVNIGNTDIQNGNVKLILGLIWSLIAHYQLGASNFPPKKLMLAWLKAVLPDCKIKNFTSDWNNGINLSALLDYCRPGLLPNWQRLSPNNGLENCKRAMDIAEREFKIPMILEPQHFASPHLDELSGMTYLSYFLKEEDSPGYYSTLNWVKNQIPNLRINNFRTDWNDGLAAAALVKSKGGPVPGFRQINNNPENWVSNIDVALKGAQKIGVSPVMESRDIANPNVEYLGVMAWAAQFQWIADKQGPGELLEVKLGGNKCRVGEKCEFLIDIHDKSQVVMDQVTAEVSGPSGPINIEFDPRDGKGHFTAKEFGMHEVLVTNDGEAVKGAPSFIRTMPNSKKDYDGIEPCAVGSTVEVLINPHHAARPDLLEVTAYSPTNRPLGCPVSEDNGTFYASFQPDEAGEWRIHVTYDNEDIENSPFKCMVFDPRAVHIPDQDSARKAKPGEPFTFTVDASKTGWGEVAIDVVYDNKSIRRTFYVEEVSHRVYQVTFTPQARGKHRVFVYLNGMEVKGSAFSLRIGKDIKEARSTNRNEAFKASTRMSGRYKKLEEQKEEKRASYAEKEVFIEKPVAPPRVKKGKRQSFKGFKEDRQALFQSDHTTEDGMDLLPVNRTIAFDCPADGCNKSDINVTVVGPDDRKCPQTIRLNDDGTFTCEFTTSLVGEHKIEIIISDEQLNVTPNFYTYDATKIKVGHLPQGYIGLPVEFDIDGKGAGFGNLEIIVNGGRVTSHVHTISKEQFQANFIPHDPGRHRVDVKFNGEKVPNSPWFVEVKDPNTPLLAPMLVANRGNAKKHENGFDTVDNNGYGNGNGTHNYSNNSELTSSLNNKFSSSSSKLNTELKQSSLFQQSKKESNFNSTINSSNTSKFESTNLSSLKSGVEDLSSLNKKKTSNSDFEKSDFGSFSLLQTPALLAGSKSSKTTTLEENNKFNSSSTEQLNSMSSSTPRATYSTTIERSVNTGSAYSSLNKPHEARLKGLTNGSSTMPKSSTFSKSIERRSSLHAKVADPPNEQKSLSTNMSNGLNSSFSKSQDLLTSSSSYAATSSSFKATHNSQSSSSTTQKATLETGSGKTLGIGPPSPKLTSYKGTADKCKFVGETVRHFNAGKLASFELFAPGAKKGDVDVNIISPEKRHIPHKVVDSGNGVFRIEFTTVEVGSYVIDVTVTGLSVPNSPLIAKAYDASLIKVTDITDGVVGDLSTFRVDASKAGEGQLEISINDGDVPNAVQVLGGGKCLVTFTPEQAITHEIEVMFNNDQVPGSPFLCRVKDADDLSYGGSSGGFSRVAVELDHLGLVPVSLPAEFTIRVPEGADAELAVSVQGPVEDIPVKVTGNVKNGFIAQFIPNAVGLHVVLVEYNGVAVGGTPFYSKAYDSDGVAVEGVPKGAVGKTVTFAGRSNES